MYDSSMVTTDRHFTKDCSLDPSRPALLLIDVQPRRTEVRMNCPHWLLALIYSVFKERPGTHHYCRCWCRVSEGLFRTDCSAGKSPSAVGGPLPDGPSRDRQRRSFRREVHAYCTRRAWTVNALRGRGRGPGGPLEPAAPLPPSKCPRSRGPDRRAAGRTQARTSPHWDNGSCYRSRLFDEVLGQIKHRKTKPYRPQTNGKVERFNRTMLEEWAYVKPYTSEAERRAAFDVFLHLYNHHRSHSALGGKPPISRVNNLDGYYT
jgi:hypothetical protein